MVESRARGTPGSAEILLRAAASATGFEDDCFNNATNCPAENARPPSTREAAHAA